MPVLVIAEHDHVGLRPATLNVVTAAAACGTEVHVLVAGSDAAGVALAATRIAGVARVLHADHPSLAHDLAENLAATVLTVASGYSHLLFAATASGKNTAPRVAALLDVAPVSEVTKVLAADTFERPTYAGNAIATVRSTEPVQVLTVRTSAFAAAAPSGGTAAVQALPAAPADTRIAFVHAERARSERPELTAARVIIAGGRALGSREQFNAVLAPLADTLGAALGASRAAVDAGFAPNDWQVGQTGKVVAPQLYLAAGISGAIQHLAGMKDSRLIVAVNHDPEAPIFSVADYGLQADLFTALPELTRHLQANGPRMETPA